MSLKEFKISKNDSLPSIEYTFSRLNCTTPNLTDFTANFKVREKGIISDRVGKQIKKLL
ncbi:hypothetical protein LCGC14_2544650 [marine sediment metagenome]|uniref:Uncharacterized protein n=1 Tax=marine sediment metagenome TaxID=412755 RepID=A0A0F9DHR9_9ZZZZ